MIIDTHAHVFTRSLRAAPDARYRPDYDATVSQCLDQLDAHGVAAGVLVQPSFLGTDNGHLLQALALAPQRLRGVAVIDEGLDDRQLAALHAAGVRGIRFNPFRRAARPNLASARWRATLARIAALGWQVVVHEGGEALIALLAQRHEFPAPLVETDHLGRPGSDPGRDAAVEYALLRRAAAAPLFIKLSAPYRGDAAALARAAARDLRALGPQQLLWGSDGPWPNFEGRYNYAAMLDWLTEVIADAGQRHTVRAAAARLYGFAPAAAR